LGVIGLSVKTCVFVGSGQIFFLIILQNVREAVEAQAEGLCCTHNHFQFRTLEYQQQNPSFNYYSVMKFSEG